MKRYAAIIATALTLVLAISASAMPSGKPGKKLEYFGTVYKITKVKVRRTIGSGYTRRRADGIYVIVKLTLTNVKSRPSTILADNIRIASRGATYTVSDDSLYVDNALYIVQQLQPHLPKKVVMLYDIPRRAVRGARLWIKDIGSGHHTTIKLGI